MICQQVTLSGDAEWPKVADAVIEAEKIGSDIRDLIVLYGIRLRCVQRQNRREGYREEGLSAPRKDRVYI
jgi:hypothetical protein